jgi:hypothetical protein
MTANLRRRLRLLRPVLLPIWRRLRPFVTETSPTYLPKVAARASVRAEDAIRRFRGRSARPIRALHHIELVDLAAAVPYYKHRIVYLDAGAKVATDLIKRRNLRTALELGPHLRSLVVGADTMDIHALPELKSETRLILHDARATPWPIPDKAYDLFLAFQVFEHLGSDQAAAFLEVRRVARHAILSLPIDWEMKDPTNSHHRLSEAFVLGWFTPVVPTRIVKGNAGHRKRLLFVFEDLPAPEPPGRPDASSTLEPPGAAPTPSDPA